MQCIRGPAPEEDLCEQSRQSVQNPQLHPVQDCQEGGDRTCTAVQCSGNHVDSGNNTFSTLDVQFKSVRSSRRGVDKVKWVDGRGSRYFSQLQVLLY